MNVYSYKSILILIILRSHQFLKLFIVVAFDDLACLHVLFERELTQFKGARELEFAIHLFVAEGVIVKDDPLQVNNQHIWHFAKILPLLDFNFFIAAVTAIIMD